MKYVKYIYTFLLAALAVVVGSCGGDEPKPSPSSASRTILVYMVSNNSLGVAGCDDNDIDEMCRAARAGHFGNGRLILFRAGTDGRQNLYEIDNQGRTVLLKEYDQTRYAISSDRMLAVMADAKALAPADDYGLIMWSHALGWTQNGQKDDIDTKTWGDDRGHTMNISTLARVLEQQRWGFVYFDCCYMGSVEVLYQLRSATSKIVASASEIPLDGMPYDKNLKLLFAAEPDLVAAARNTFEYYDALSGDDRTCTISVFDLKGMEQLATASRAIYEASTKVSVRDFENLPLSTDFRPLFYDFGVYVRGMAGANDVRSQLTEGWNRAYANVVTYKMSTPKLWDSISLSNFTGISTYIPRTVADMTYRNYNTLDWYTDVASALYK